MGTRKITAFYVAVLAGGLLAGCSSGENKPQKIRKLEGIAKKIDQKAGVVSMLWKNDKGEERILEGTIKEGAEIWINGRAAKLDDIRIGDKVVVFGYREKTGGEEKLVATRVEANRPDEMDWKPVGKAATTQPANHGAPNTKAPTTSH